MQCVGRLPERSVALALVQPLQMYRQARQHDAPPSSKTLIDTGSAEITFATREDWKYPAHWCCTLCLENTPQRVLLVHAWLEQHRRRIRLGWHRWLYPRGPLPHAVVHAPCSQHQAHSVAFTNAISQSLSDWRLTGHCVDTIRNRKEREQGPP